jgi:hypothetical protein
LRYTSAGGVQLGDTVLAIFFLLPPGARVVKEFVKEGTRETVLAFIPPMP